MKKVLVFLLATLMVVSCILLVACDVTVTEISLKDVPEKVTQNATIDYSKIYVVAKHDDDSVKEIPLTDKSVTYTPINTTTTGAKTLSVTYGGKNAQATIIVEAAQVDVTTITVTEFNNTAGYNAYQTARAEKGLSEKESEFVKRDEPYKVGTANGYKLVPQVTAIDENVNFVEVPEAQINTDYTLYVKVSGSWTEVTDTTTYLSKVENNIYYFKQNAEGREIKLVVTLGEGLVPFDDSTDTEIEQEFLVVDGYNVYDALGLSVLDNLNVNSWANLKTHKNDWDGDKTLADFTDVTQVILHNNITITGKYLPNNYFWMSTTEAGVNGGTSYQEALSIATGKGYEEYLLGSLKETRLGEDWETGNNNQRGLYTSDGIGLSGNYLTIDYQANYNTKGEKGLYVVYDFNQSQNDPNFKYPEGHWSIIKYYQQDENGNNNGTIENVYFVGETGKTEDSSEPCGLMMLTTMAKETTVNNTIGAGWFCNLELDADGYGILNVDSCKFYDSFSQMIFSRRNKEINVSNSEMKRAGGPLIIMHTRTHTDGKDEHVTNTVFNVDSTAKLESWLTGSETWFDLHNLAAPVVSMLLQIASLSDNPEFVGTHYMTADNKVNLIAVVIPEPTEVFNNTHPIKGTINVGEYSYGMEETAYSAVVNMSATAAKAATAASDTADKLGSLLGENAEYMPLLEKGFGDLRDATALLPYAPMFKCGDTFGYGFGTDPTQLELLSLEEMYNGIATKQQGAPMSLYAAVEMLISEIGKAIPTLEAMGDPYGNLEDAKDLLQDWQDVKAGLDPVVAMNFVDEATWKASWTAGQLACWVNPAGLGNAGNVPFMILIGEGTASALA